MAHFNVKSDLKFFNWNLSIRNDLGTCEINYVAYIMILLYIMKINYSRVIVLKYKYVLLKNKIGYSLI